MMIHLKRFTFNYVSMQRIKLDSVFTFQRQLDMSAFVPDSTAADSDLQYELYGILIHVGTARGGHYFAYIKDLYEAREDESSEGDNSWYVFDDSTVAALPAREVAAMFCTGKKVEATPAAATTSSPPDSENKCLDLDFEHSETLKVPLSKLWAGIRDLNVARLFPSRFKTSTVDKASGKDAHEVGSVRRVTLSEVRTHSLAFVEVVAVKPERSVAFVQRKTRLAENESASRKVTTLELLPDTAGNDQQTLVCVVLHFIFNRATSYGCLCAA